MKIIMDHDATVVNYRKFVDRYAIPYFKTKHNMGVVYEDKLEIEDIFDCRRVFINRGYTEEEAEKQTKEVVDKFWVSSRYIMYSMPWMFFPKAAKTLRNLRKQGHHIEIHTSKVKTSERNIIGTITRVLMYLQYWSNGIFIPCRQFVFYENDEKKTDGIINSSPDVVFEDKLEIIEELTVYGIKCLCVLGKHNKRFEESRNAKGLSGYEYSVVDETIMALLGEKKWNLHKEIAKSDILYRRLLRLKNVVRKGFKPIVLNENRLTKVQDRGIVYASNHRRTLDPIVFATIIDEPIRYAALKRFFEAKDSIFNNSKNIALCKLTAIVFCRLKFFPIERIWDNNRANNTESIKNMVNYLKIKGKLGIFPEGTTLKGQDKDFGTFNDSFVKLAALTDAIIQPINIYWFKYKKRHRCVVNFGEVIVVQKSNVMEAYEEFVQCQEVMLMESKVSAKQWNEGCGST